MYVKERSDVNQPNYKQSVSENQLLPKGPLTYQFRGSNTQNRRAQCGPLSLGESGRLGASDVLDTANNRLQELMQLLYLLSRDPAIPKDARYHVTVAQSEIALLVRIMQNAEEAALQGAAGHQGSGGTASPTTL